MTESTLSTASKLLAGYDESMAQTLQAEHTPGCSIVLLHEDHTLLRRGYGRRDLENDLPADEHSLYGIASTSKAFTTTAMALLADRGLLNWDAPVQQVLPEFRLSDPDICSRITPRDLVSHRTGLPRHDFLWYMSRESRLDLFSRLAHLPFSRNLREEYQYNNLMFMVAGVLVERIAGMSWEEFVRQELFEPLGMKHSNFSVEDLRDDSNVALPHTKSGEEVRRIPFCNLDAVGPCGSINSCAADLGHWLQFHLGQGEFNGKRLLSAASLAETYRPHAIVPPAASQFSEFAEFGQGMYGLGWMVRSYRGRPLLMHTGGIDGYSSVVAVLPEDNMGAAVLANRENSSVPIIAAFELFDRLLNMERIPWRKVFAAREQNLKAASDLGDARLARKRKPDAGPTHPLEIYTGVYAHPAYGRMKIGMKDGDLQIRYNQLELQLAHYHHDVFHATAANLDLKMPVQFTLDEWGEVDALIARCEPAVEPLRFTRQPEAVDAARLAGRYHRRDQEIQVTDEDGNTWRFPNRVQFYDIVFHDGGAIFMLANGESPRELIPEFALAFRVKSKPAERVEFHEENGQITALDLIQEYSVIQAKKSPAK